MATRRVVRLPLLVRTPDEWGTEVMTQPLELLNDHAHLERKAASNALEMLHRWPEPCPPVNWVQLMTAVARDEVDHLATVTRLLSRRGGRLTRSHRNPYANALRGLVRVGEGPKELMDRLMISSLIEARSCERFEILSRSAGRDRTLKKLYEELWTSEHGHYKVFLKMAQQVRPKREVDRAWHRMLEAEAEIIQSQTAGPRMHSWPA